MGYEEDFGLNGNAGNATTPNASALRSDVVLDGRTSQSNDEQKQPNKFGHTLF
jgi:hypothetical protein